MTTFLRSTAVLLMVGAALAATPLRAAEAVPGNSGRSGNAANRDVPLALPRAVPLPTPKFDPATLSRGLFDRDSAAALDSLATLTRSADGSLAETPASGALRGIFERAVTSRRAAG